MTCDNKIIFTSLFVTPLMQVQLDIDLEKLTEFVFQMQELSPANSLVSGSANKGGWQSNDLIKETHEEFIRLKKEISQHLQIYHLEAFNGMEFKENVIQDLCNMWVNINEKHHYIEWHTHGFSTLSGVYYIKHDNFENGNILFKHPVHHFPYITSNHWPEGMVKKTNEMTSEFIKITPKPNMLLIFPSWIEHKAEPNLKNDSRISLSFDSIPILEKNRNEK